ncbi:MAG: hypothetical protein GDA51_00780, partial [Ekhidna sp.]|nr:hypothetical protein [Ekhidna sp.]
RGGGGVILVFSYVGFETQEVEVGSRTTIDISMGGAVELQEVIVTSYGTSNKKDFTGSAEDFKLRPVTNPIAAIEGNATGVQFMEVYYKV